MNVIIIAALAIIVLIVLTVMVTQRANLFGKGLRNVSEQTCSPSGRPQPIGSPCDVIYGSFSDVGADKVCCRVPEPQPRRRRR